MFTYFLEERRNIGRKKVNSYLAYFTSAILIIFGLYGVIFKRNLIKIVIGVSLMECGANLFLVSVGFRKGGIAPIYTMAPEGYKMVLPTPQALTLTSIVIGLATTALMLTLTIVLYKHYGTLDPTKIRGLMK